MYKKVEGVKKVYLFYEKLKLSEIVAVFFIIWKKSVFELDIEMSEGVVWGVGKKRSSMFSLISLSY